MTLWFTMPVRQVQCTQNTRLMLCSAGFTLALAHEKGITGFDVRAGDHKVNTFPLLPDQFRDALAHDFRPSSMLSWEEGL